MQSQAKRIIAAIVFIVFGAIANAQRNPLVVTIDGGNRAQTIQNIGVSGCWFSEPIGKYWPLEKKQRIAELLFSKKTDSNGNPSGIGVSMFRFNVGAGTAEQGVDGGIADPKHRVECFLNTDGQYDWRKQSGYQWFLQQAKGYGVENLLLFSNSPPVQFTINGRGFKTTKDTLANLKPGSYGAYAGFLATVIEHFERAGLKFDYVSPVNEPQWDWMGKPGEAKQEGTPWTNDELYRVTKSLDSALQSKQLRTQVTVTEAAMLSFLYGGKTVASRQAQHLFDESSAISVAGLQSVPRMLAGHSYFTDGNDSTLVLVRKNLADTIKKYRLQFWQSEYCMLGNGYKEGSRDQRSPMDCALFLAKVIHTDLTVANASAWHFWNAYEPGNPGHDNRYYLVALKPDSGFTNGSFTATKNLWALGQYSLFVRPGMRRLNISRSDSMTDIEAAQKIMVSAYIGKANRVVVVAINYTSDAQPVKLNLQQIKKMHTLKSYVTSSAGNDNMRFVPMQNLDGIVLLPRSITTFVID